MLLFADDIPSSPVDVLMLPMIVLFFGALVYIGGYVKGTQIRKLPRFRWIGTAILVLAAFLGFQNMWHLWNPDTGTLYRDSIVSRRIIYAHYISFFFPVLCLIGVGAMEFLFVKKNREWE